MLTEIEKQGCKDILNKLTIDDIFALADTITKKQINVSSKNEAVEAVVSYTEQAVDFLRRRRIKRDVLFKYLADDQVVVSVAADKRALIRTILQKWGSTDADIANMDINMSEDDITTQTAGTSTATMTSHGAQTDRHTDNTPSMHASTSIDTSINLSHGHASGDNMMVPSNLQNGQLAQSQFGQLPGAMATSSPYTQTTQTVSNPAQNAELQALGEKFVKWFYEILNSFNPTMNVPPKDFGPHHFWDDSTLTIHVHTPSPNEEKFDGAMLVAQRLLAFVKDELLLFNPNVSRDGVFVQSNPHGLVRILTCGTIHRGNDCLGVFQQVFGIITDPRYDSNWKIKITKLDVRSSQVTAMPKLEGDVDNIVNALIPAN